MIPARPNRGNALAPLLLILGALAVSGIIFFVFTRKKIEADRAARAQAETVEPGAAPSAAPPGGAPATKPPPGPPVADLPSPKTPAPPATPAPVPFASPTDFAQQWARRIASGDLAAAARMLAPDDPARSGAARGVLEKIIGGLGYRVGAPETAQLIGQVENLIRVAVPLVPTAAGAPPARLMLDLERDPQWGWKVAQVHLPKELAGALANLPEPPPAATPVVRGTGGALPSIATPPAGSRPAMARPFLVVDQTPDALSYASDFVAALLRLDYEGARKLADAERVPPVKLAALCIVFEEGKYRLSDDKPLVATVATETSSWVITRVYSDSLAQQTEFGLEMERVATGWQVGGLNLSKLLSDTAKPSAIGGVAYAPLIMNPKGGESIALFFELDQAVLHPRAQKQLDIIAGILRASPQKKLKIGGYTDALGSDAYNLNLSQRRAEAVKQYILTRAVPESQVETTGFGKSLPLSPNVKPDGSDNPEGRSLNRRAEILLDF